MAGEINVLKEDIGITNAMPQYNRAVEMLDLPGFKGTQSAFNPYVVFSLHSVGETDIGGYNYTMHYDMLPTGFKVEDNISGPGEANVAEVGLPSTTDAIGVIPFAENANSNFVQRRKVTSIPVKSMAYLAPTAENIIKYSNGTTTITGIGPAPYSWTDFLYCKYYGKIPNNHMVTLRRYPYPISDNAIVPNGHQTLPVAQAVTWFGEQTENKLSDLLKMTYGVLWKEIEAIVQEVDGNERAFGSGAESLAGAKAVSAAGAVLTATRGSYSQWSGAKEKGIEWSKKAWTNEGPYWDQIYGPVNVVHKSNMRDRGLKFQHEVKLNFHYSIRSNSGINPKVAMLDLITNFLVLTYTNAKFWGGATRYFPNATFRVGFLGDQSKFYAGDYKGYATSIGSELKSTLGDLKSMLTKAFSLDFSAITSALTNLIGGNMAEKSMPQALSIRSMLSGEAVGEWHVTIGNPMNPIAVIGNLILDETVIEFGDTLGADDFPTEVKFTVKLKPGKPRDKGDLESMFNSGYGRMSYAPTTTLPSAKNTFGADKTKFGKVDPSTEKSLAESLAYKTSGDESLKMITERVTSQWGKPFGESANLLFMINSTKSRF